VPDTQEPASSADVCAGLLGGLRIDAFGLPVPPHSGQAGLMTPSPGSLPVPLQLEHTPEGFGFGCGCGAARLQSTRPAIAYAHPSANASEIGGPAGTPKQPARIANPTNAANRFTCAPRYSSQLTNRSHVARARPRR
jgi:hypothetical protein